MKIITVPFLSILPNVNKVYAAEAVDAVGNVNQLQFGASQQKFDASQQQLNVKKVLKDEIQRKVSELQTLFTGKGHDNPKVKFIIDKFQSGKKLTPDERAYLSQHAKGVIDHIERVSREREFVEQRMKAAPSKMDMQNAVLLSLQQIAKHPSPEERIVRALQIADAQYEYIQTDDYKNKPNGPLDERLKQSSNHLANKSHMQHTLMAIVAYEQAKAVTIS